MQGCVILNGDYSYLNTVNWRKAMKALKKGKTTVLRYSDEVVRTAENVIEKVPAVMKLLYIIRTIYRTKVPFSKKNIMIRDNFGKQEPFADSYVFEKAAYTAYYCRIHSC